MRRFISAFFVLFLLSCGSQKQLSKSVPLDQSNQDLSTGDSSVSSLLESDFSELPPLGYAPDSIFSSETGSALSRKSLHEGPKMSEVIGLLSKVENASNHKEKKEAKKQLKEWAKNNIQQRKAEVNNGDDFDSNTKKARTWGIISFISSLLIVPLWPLWVLAVVGGIISLSKYKKSFDKRLRFFPIIALAISGFWLLIVVLAIMFLVLFWRGF